MAISDQNNNKDKHAAAEIAIFNQHMLFLEHVISHPKILVPIDFSLLKLVKDNDFTELYYIPSDVKKCLSTYFPEENCENIQLVVPYKNANQHLAKAILIKNELGDLDFHQALRKQINPNTDTKEYEKERATILQKLPQINEDTISLFKENKDYFYDINLFLKRFKVSDNYIPDKDEEHNSNNLTAIERKYLGVVFLLKELHKRALIEMSHYSQSSRDKNVLGTCRISLTKQGYEYYVQRKNIGIADTNVTTAKAALCVAFVAAVFTGISSCSSFNNTSKENSTLKKELETYKAKDVTQQNTAIQELQTNTQALLEAQQTNLTALNVQQQMQSKSQTINAAALQQLITAQQRQNVILEAVLLQMSQSSEQQIKAQEALLKTLLQPDVTEVRAPSVIIEPKIDPDLK